MISEYVQITIAFVGLVMSATRTGYRFEDPQAPVFSMITSVMFLVLLGIKVIPYLP